MLPELKNKIADIFSDIADLLEVRGDNVFRVRAYRRGAEVVRSVSDPSEEGVPGIGKDLHAKILEIQETGRCAFYEDLLHQFPNGILDVLHVRGLGPKRVKLFYEQLGIHNLEQLKSAAESGAIAALPGMGEKSQTLILTALEQMTHEAKRLPYLEALPLADAYVEYMLQCPHVKHAQYAGSLRRKKATVGDADILVIPKRATAKSVEAIHEWFVAYPSVIQVLAKGDTRSSVVLDQHFQVDLRVISAESFGAALLYFTGSKQFNIDLRTLALKHGLKVNEYGLFKGEVKIAGLSEEEMFKKLGMDFVPPEERER